MSLCPNCNNISIELISHNETFRFNYDAKRGAALDFSLGKNGSHVDQPY